MSRTQEINNEIIEKLDVLAEYAALGVVFDGDARPSGWAACFAAFRDEEKASAAVNIATGYYVDSGVNPDGSKDKMSLWDFAVKRGRFQDWRAARQYYADKVGVTVSRRKRRSRDPDEQLMLLDWTDGRRALAASWCRNKPGITVEAIERAGGRLAQWPCRPDRKTGEKKPGRYKCIALPIYGPKLLDSGPIGYVIYNQNGRPFEWEETVNGSKKTRTAKMMTISRDDAGFGGTKSGLMNRHAIERLATSPDAIELIWLVEGPTDMLAMQSVFPDEYLDRHIVTCNTGGSAQEPGELISFFGGATVYVVRDRDTSGEVGLAKWSRDLLPIASAESRSVVLPYEMQAKNGRDLRDWLVETAQE